MPQDRSFGTHLMDGLGLTIMAPEGTSDSYLRTVQYGTPDNLEARVAVHVLFSTNKQGWPNWLFEKFEFSSPAEILEIGCGPGAIWESKTDKVPRDWHLTLTDFSAGMVSSARKALRGKLSARFAVVDAQSLPLPEGAFDGVMAHHMLYHVPDKRAALGEIARVLREGGKLYAGTNGPDHLRQLWDLIKRFAPDATSPVFSGSFDLVNGPDQVAEFLEVVAVEQYPDALEVTDPGPLIDYIRSMTTLEDVSDEQLKSIEAELRQIISSEGSFHIDKQAGLITALAA